MPNDAFERVNQIRENNGDQLFANARNATAGTPSRSIPPSSSIGAGLHRAWRGGAIPEGMPDGYVDFIQLIAGWGLPTSDLVRRCDSIDEAVDVVEQFSQTRNELNYGVDVMVVRVDEFNSQSLLGATSKAPRWCVAFKYPAEQGRTRLTRVDWQVGKNGTLTPRATMDPVPLAGTVVQHATLHNIEEIRRKDIRTGDMVVVEKAGEIIPQVVSVVVADRSGTELVIEPPDICPACDGLVEQEGPKLYCVNPECPAQLRERIAWFVGRNQMNIDGLGEKVVDQLLQAGLIHHLSDLYALRAEDLLPLAAWAHRFRISWRRSMPVVRGGFARVLCSWAYGTWVDLPLVFSPITSGTTETLMDASVSPSSHFPTLVKSRLGFFMSSPHSTKGKAVFAGLKDAGVGLGAGRGGGRQPALRQAGRHHRDPRIDRSTIAHRAARVDGCQGLRQHLGQDGSAHCR